MPCGVCVCVCKRQKKSEEEQKAKLSRFARDVTSSQHLLDGNCDGIQWAINGHCRHLSLCWHRHSRCCLRCVHRSRTNTFPNENGRKKGKLKSIPVCISQLFSHKISILSMWNRSQNKHGSSAKTEGTHRHTETRARTENVSENFWNNFNDLN